MLNDEHDKLLRDRKQAWWTSVLAGQIDHPYPVPRSSLRTRFEGATLVIAGTVPSEQDREEIMADLKMLVGNAINAFQAELEVVSESEEESGLLAQSLVGTFDDATQARFAAAILKNQGQIQEIVLEVLAPESSASSSLAEAAWRTLLSDAHWEDVRATLAENHAVLILTVDETQAFQAREILDEETRSLRTVVLPPIPASVAKREAKILAEAATLPSSQAPRSSLGGENHES